MKKTTRSLSLIFVFTLLFSLFALNVSAATAEPIDASASSAHVHSECADEAGPIITAAACNHVGTLKGTTYVGTCGSCRGPLYYVYCTVCGKYTGARICLC